MDDKLLARNELANIWPARSGLAPMVLFEPDEVPEPLRVLIPYAEIWGIADDALREEILNQTPPQVVTHLKEVVSVFDGELDEWLAGQEALTDELTDAYVAFSAMRIGADLA